MLDRTIDFIAHNIGIFWTIGVLFVIGFGCERLVKLDPKIKEKYRDCPSELFPLCLSQGS